MSYLLPDNDWATALPVHLGLVSLLAPATVVRNAGAMALVSVALLLMATVTVAQNSRTVSALTEFLHIAARVTYILVILVIAAGELLILLIHG